MKVTKDDAVADNEDNTDATVLTDTVDVLEETAVRVGVNSILLVPVMDGVDVLVGDLDLVLVTVTVREGVCEKLAAKDFEPLVVPDAVELLVRVIDGVNVPVDDLDLVTVREGVCEKLAAKDFEPLVVPDAVELLVRVIDGVDVPVDDLDLLIVTVTVREGVCERLATIVDNDFETLAVDDAVKVGVDCAFPVRVTGGVLDRVPDFDGVRRTASRSRSRSRFCTSWRH
jgi:diphthamide synthase (EF-2-diphthine--ammonia ligase)